MNGETNTETTKPPPKVEAPPKAEAPGVERGIEKTGPLKPAETAILKITGEPGTKRDDPRGEIQKIAEIFGEKPPPTKDEMKQMLGCLNDTKTATPEQLNTLAENTAHLTDEQLIRVLDKIGAPEGRKIVVDRNGKPAEIPLDDPYPSKVTGGETYKELNDALLTLEDQHKDSPDPDNPHAKARGEIAQALKSRLNTLAELHKDKPAPAPSVSDTEQAQLSPKQPESTSYKSGSQPAAETPVQTQPPVAEAPQKTPQHSTEQPPQTGTPSEKQIIDPAAQDAKSAKQMEADNAARFALMDQEKAAAKAAQAQAETPDILGETPPVEPATKVSPDKLHEINDRIKTGGASDREASLAETQQQPAAEAQTQTSASGETPNEAPASAAPVEDATLKPSAEAETATPPQAQIESAPPPTPPEAPTIDNQDLLKAMSGAGDETPRTQQDTPEPPTPSTPEANKANADLLQKMTEVAGENAAIDTEAQAQQKAIEDINTKLTESGVSADKQDEINNTLKENPHAAPDVAAELNNINTADKSEADAKIQQLEEEINQLKQKLEQGQQLTPDEQDKLTKGTLVLAIIAAIIAGTFEGLKEGLEQSAQLK